MTKPAGYNIKVRLEAVDERGRVLQFAEVTRNIVGNAPLNHLRPAFNEEANA